MPRSAPSSRVPESRDSSTERVTISSLPASGEAVIRGHAGAALVELPSRWLDQLLVVATELPIEEGDVSVARVMVESLAMMLPDHAVGACLVPRHGGPQQVLRAMPQGEEHRGAGTNPARIFPGYEYERVVDLGDGGSTLHVGSSDGACDDGRSPTSALIDRAAMIARRGLMLAREHVRATMAASELRSLHSHMVQAEKLASLGQIAAGVVHELNNPLTSIVAYTDFLIRKVTARGASADPDEVDRLRRIAESAGRMLRFTRDLVSYARPSSEIPVQVGVHMVVDQALAFCEHILNEAGVRVERRFGARVPPVRGKPEQLAQVFVNLITNACHAMHDAGNGELTISTDSDGSVVLVVVSDNGHGILQEHLAHVFTPFFTTKGSGIGTGLGLTIVKSIVDGHEGTIDVRSVTGATGSGTTFTMILPAATTR